MWFPTKVENSCPWKILITFKQRESESPKARDNRDILQQVNKQTAVLLEDGTPSTKKKESTANSCSISVKLKCILLSEESQTRKPAYGRIPLI